MQEQLRPWSVGTGTVGDNVEGGRGCWGRQSEISDWSRLRNISGGCSRVANFLISPTKDVKRENYHQLSATLHKSNDCFKSLYLLFEIQQRREKKGMAEGQRERIPSTNNEEADEGLHSGFGLKNCEIMT